MQPVIAPTSSVPSAMPSRTGFVANFEITSTVTTSLTEAEVDAIEAEILSGFDILQDEVTTTGIIHLSHKLLLTCLSI